MAGIKGEILAGAIKFFSAVSTWIFLIVLGVIGMLGHNLYIGKRMTFWQSVGSVMVAVFVGVLTSLFCHFNGWTKIGSVLVPVMTLVADKVMMAIISFNWQGNIKQILKDLINKWK